MKSFIQIIFILSLVFTTGQTAFAQQKVKKKKVETTEFKVSGVCKMCKERIENAALIKGVKFVEWSKESQKIKVIFNNRKVKLDDIHAAIAEHGHDTEKVKAKDEVYEKLPKCCAYRDGVEVH